jgi:hypothetical protein
MCNEPLKGEHVDAHPPEHFGFRARQACMKSHPEHHRAARLEDHQVTGLLAELRARPVVTRAEDDATISAIAELECEAARRGLELGAVPEPTPPRLACQRCMEALEGKQFEVAFRMMAWMDPEGLWRVYRYALAIADLRLRLWHLQPLLFFLDAGILGRDAACARKSNLEASGMDEREREAYVRHCIDALFNDAMLRWLKPY